MDERKTVTFMRNLLYLSCFIDLFAVSFIVPVLGAHLRSLGFSHSLIGITSTVYAGTQLFSGPIIGSWSDRYGRKVVLYLTLFVCSLAYCFLGVASSLTVILLIRVTLGLMKHTQTICKTLVADVFSKDKQIEIQGKLNAIAASGFMVGPIIGGHIVELDNGFQYICVTVSVLFFFNGLIVFLFFPDNIVSTTDKPSKKTEKPVNNNCNTFKSDFSRIITDLFLVDWKSFWDVFLLKFILGVAVSLFFGCYYSFVEETFNITPKYIGYTISFQGLISAASGMQIKMFNKFYAEKSTASSYFLKLYHCFLILSITYIFVYLSSNFYIFLFCLLLLSSSTSLIRIITTELLLIKSSENHRGSLMGASNSTSSSARMITPLITGVLQDSFKSSGVMILASVLSLTGSVISYVLNSKSIVKEKTT